MSLTSYRAAPPRVGLRVRVGPGRACVWVRFVGRALLWGNAWLLSLGPPGRFAPCPLAPWGAVRCFGLCTCAHRGPAAIRLGIPISCPCGISEERERLIGSGGDLLSHVLRRSTIGAAGLNGRVRDGTGCFPRAVTTRPWKHPRGGFLGPAGSKDGACWLRR